jgi:Transposase, Mutator family
MSDTSTVPRKPEGGKPARRPLVDEELADQLLGKAQAEGVELLGPDGLLSQVTKAVLERALAEEMTGHLGYERHDPAGRGSGNSRNGTTPKTVLADVGAVDLAVPRDRNGSFEPQIVRKGQTRLEGSLNACDLMSHDPSVLRGDKADGKPAFLIEAKAGSYPRRGTAYAGLSRKRREINLIPSLQSLLSASPASSGGLRPGLRDG